MVGGIEFTREEILGHVAKKMIESMNFHGSDDDGEPFNVEWAQNVQAQMRAMINSRVEKGIAAAVAKLAEEVVDPKLEEMIRGALIQRTNYYGEKRGEAMSFTEYLVTLAQESVDAEVDMNGKTKEQSDRPYDWRKSGTRLSHAIDRYMMSYLDAAMKTIVASANETFVDGMTKSIQHSLTDLASRVKVRATVPGT